MKIVKLDKRHRLFRSGMVYAFKFENEWEEKAQVENILRNMYGWEYGNRDWNTFRGKVVVIKSAQVGKSRTYPYWVGVRKEEDITAVMLQL